MVDADRSVDATTAGADPAGEPDGSSLVRSSAAVAAGTFLSRLTGLARVALLAYAIGRGTLADTYGLANQMPNVVYELILGGVLSATLVPVLVDFRRDERAISAVFTVALSVLTVLTAVAVVFAPLISQLLSARAVDAEAQEATMTYLLRLFLPQMAFYGLTALATALLNAHRRFVAAAFAPVLNNVVVITMALTFVSVTSGARADWEDVNAVRGDTGLLLLLGIGTTAGIAAMALVLIPALARARIRIRPVFEWRHRAVVRILRLSGWTVGYVIVNQIALLVVLLLAESEAGGIAAYQYAFIFFQLPHGLLAVSIMTTVLPELARHAAVPDMRRFCERYAWGLRLLVLVVLPAAVAFVVFAEPAVGLMRFGAFDTGDVQFTADTLQAFAVGLLAFSAYLYTLRGFYALQDTRTPFLVNLVENGVNIALAFALFSSYGIRGLALAYAIAYAIGAVIAYALLRRRVGALEGRRTLDVAWRAALGAGALGFAGWLLRDQLYVNTPRSSVLTLIVAGGASVAVYLAVTAALQTPGLTDLTSLVRRRSSTG